MGCELVQADLAYRLSRFGAPNSGLSSRLSFIGWDNFETLFCAVSGNSYRSEFGCFLNNRNFDFRLVLATIRHLAIFAIWFYLVRSRLLFCLYFVLGHRFHAPVVGAALARLIPKRAAGTWESDRAIPHSCGAPLDTIDGLCACFVAAGSKIGSPRGLRFPRSVAWIQSDDRGQPILFSTCAGV